MVVYLDIGNLDSYWDSTTPLPLENVKYPINIYDMSQDSLNNLIQVPSGTPYTKDEIFVLYRNFISQFGDVSNKAVKAVSEYSGDLLEFIQKFGITFVADAGYEYIGSPAVKYKWTTGTVRGYNTTANVSITLPIFRITNSYFRHTVLCRVYDNNGVTYWYYSLVGNYSNNQWNASTSKSDYTADLSKGIINNIALNVPIQPTNIISEQLTGRKFWRWRGYSD